MAKKILFTPVGGTDPISENNLRDGAILQICRKYRPDEVYLYMSAEILEKQEKDDRYRYCLNKLNEKIDHEAEIKVIARPDLYEVQKFDYFYSDFADILSKIELEMDKEDELILNVSSGTPAMKSALMVLCTLTGRSCSVVQVSTPTKKMNEHSHKGEDISVLWEMNLDNDPSEYADRTEEVECPWILANQKKKLIKTHVLAYDYEAALQVNAQFPLYKDGTYVQMIEAAAERKCMNGMKMFEILRSIGEERNMAFRPVKSDEMRMLFEYILTLNIRQKRGEYGDLIRAMTPPMLELFIQVLKKSGSINIDEYLYYNNEKKRRWNLEKLENSELFTVIGGELKPFVYSWQIIKLIDKYVTDQRIVDICNELRDVEESIRNRVAHELVGVSDEFIKANVGLDSGEIISLIQKVLFYVDGGLKKYWNSYDEMNVFILERMERELG